ncbi:MULTISPECIES: adenylate/guanylate cyclase domain-containing protein [unclassified Mycolicibacterium]|uniref:adenylate/guanylate cyclase domain-containing protein n=1 Tax=unclassified Mycolicibacterium TaxID=2636767 RepID=UPI0028152E51|nr:MULTISPECIES: adenylate/guanylate cyclase domain-containing protein [unclassified Mycolicibacterium]
MSDAPVEGPLGYLDVSAPGVPRRRVPIFGQLFVGRECPGIPPERRMVVDDPQISRNHLEVRLDAETARAFVIDTSTNGTRINGMRLERAVPMLIKSGDVICVGDLTLTFDAARFTGSSHVDPGLTRARINLSPMVMVVGDIVNYSTLSEVTDPGAIASGLNMLWGELSAILRAHRGTLNHYAGDALYAVWEPSAVPDAVALAITFALAASERVGTLGPGLPLRNPDGSPIQMGWAVVQGDAALSAMTRSVEAVIGDSTNVAFRLSGLAGRDGRAAVMVTAAVQRAARDRFMWGPSEQVMLKGRQGQETVFPVLAPAAAQQSSATDGAMPAHRTGPSSR